MRYILSLVCIFLMIAASALADADVKELQLSRQNEEVVLEITASGAFQFSHQIEEAKDGKPFRVIVDIFPAIHNLGQKSFYDLPASIVKSVRTSQFAVKPTRTVRIVLDLGTESVYRIEKISQSVFVYIRDSKASEFPVWSSRNYHELKKDDAAPVRKVEKTPVIAQVSLKDKVSTEMPAETKEQAPVHKTEKNMVSTAQATRSEYTYHKPKRSSVIEQDISKPAPSKQVKTPPGQLAQAESKVVEKKSEPPQKVKESIRREGKRIEKPAEPVTETPHKTMDKAQVPTKKVASGKEPKSEDKPSTAPPVKKQNKEEQMKTSRRTEYAGSTKNVGKAAGKLDKAAKSATRVVKAGTKEKTRTEPAVEFASKVEDENKPQPVTTAGAPAKSEGTKKPTSRFRRQPLFPAKLKGTIVAEFPKRMVIKYSPTNSRDPFASLFEENKKARGPLERKVPDIETARLVGILESTAGRNRALLEDIDGFGFILKPGDKVKKGYVSQIYSDKALFNLFEYGWSRTVALRLSENE